MHIFFLVLAAITTALFAASFYFVWLAPDRLLHFYCGLIGTISALITHCWVFFYFIGTGQGIREGVFTHRLDPIHIKKTKKFKARTFPFALFSMIFLIVATVLGAGVQAARVAPAWHFGFAYFAVAFHLFSFYQEYRVIRTNQRLMADLNRQIARESCDSSR